MGITIRDKTLQKQFLRQPILILKKATKFIRVFEVSKEQLKTINGANISRTEVDGIKSKRLQSNYDSTKQYNELNSVAFDCHNSGRKHEKR